MKTLFTFLMIGSSFASVTTLSANPDCGRKENKIELSIKKSEEINCRGRLSPPTGIRRIGQELSAFLEENAVSVRFYQNVGTVNISVIDDSGIVVTSTVFDSADGDLQIPIDTLPIGSYSIKFENAYGTMTGDFIL